jgi:hypothetical protein
VTLASVRDEDAIAPGVIFADTSHGRFLSGCIYSGNA